MILLIRHCTVLINYDSCDYNSAKEKVQEYNDTSNLAIEEIFPIQHHINDFLEGKQPIIFASSLPRAYQTAKYLFGKKCQLTVSDEFVEFDLNIFPIPFLKCKFKTWLLISRILWFLNISKTTRNFSYEARRAKSCANLLYKEAYDSSVALVSHGLLNFFIEKNLKKQNYRRIYKVRNGCFSITRLEL